MSSFSPPFDGAEFRDFDDHAVLHDLTLNRALFLQRRMQTRSMNRGRLLPDLLQSISVDCEEGRRYR